LIGSALLVKSDQSSWDFTAMARVLGFISVAFLALTLRSPAAFSQDIATALMNSTFEIAGPDSTPGKVNYGTAFLLGKPMKAEPQRAYFVLVTAAHVLDLISGDEATLLLRHKEENGNYTTIPTQIEIRQNGANLYVKNPNADVAAMYIRMPDAAAFDLLPISFLSDDARLDALDIHPGDELQCLGFPLAISINGFPVIRSGLVASYPITPTKAVHSLYYNFHTLPGNSGGPVYFSFVNRVYKGATHLGDIQQGIVGLVAQQVSSKVSGFENVPIDISVIVPSSYIKDTVDMLPEEPSQ
jgi:hypothetical protein